jgi:hypothetical protein
MLHVRVAVSVNTQSASSYRPDADAVWLSDIDLPVFGFVHVLFWLLLEETVRCSPARGAEPGSSVVVIVVGKPPQSPRFAN